MRTLADFSSLFPRDVLLHYIVDIKYGGYVMERRTKIT